MGEDLQLAFPRLELRVGGDESPPCDNRAFGPVHHLGDHLLLGDLPPVVGWVGGWVGEWWIVCFFGFRMRCWTLGKVGGWVGKVGSLGQ